MTKDLVVSSCLPLSKNALFQKSMDAKSAHGPGGHRALSLITAVELGHRQEGEG